MALRAVRGIAGSVGPWRPASAALCTSSTVAAEAAAAESSIRSPPTPAQRRQLVQDIFPAPLHTAPRDAQTASHQWMARAGLIRQSAAGVYSILPLGQRSLEKITKVVCRELDAIGCQRLALPCLTTAQLWEKTGRWESTGEELFKLSDRRKAPFCLGPTHEEAITELAASFLQSHKQLPWRLYQLDRKFRDELRPRFGLMRCREFWMKDLYTFDATEEGASVTYDAVCQAYHRIFAALQLPTVVVEADSGNIGGSLSHEFHVPAQIGETDLAVCDQCDASWIIGEEGQSKGGGGACCKNTADGGSCKAHVTKGIEVGHAFYLGTKYSAALDASFTTADGTETSAEMGCFGLGITRILATVVEQFHDKDGICWPVAVAPYSVCIVSMGKGCDQMAEAVYDRLSAGPLAGDIVLDTSERSAGVKFNNASVVGYPFVVIVGSKHDPEALEVETRAPGAGPRSQRLSLPALEAAVQKLTP
eukprot:m.299690 g.299690  ORF g.299690 m.299690 type:complete len:477 (+) comp19549_c0_seq9:84-1514(+)